MDGLKTSSTYALYKARQNKFTNWLKHTADSCSNVSKSGKKSKPKSKHSSILPNSTVQISEFQGLASIVVNNFSTEEIPLAMVQTLRDVIHQRRQSAQFFHRLSEDAGRADEDLLRKNDGHVHIIKVLENVLKVFEDKLRARARELKEAEVWRAEEKEEAATKNTFGHLEVQSPYIEDGDDAATELGELHLHSAQPRSKKPKKASAPKSKSRSNAVTSAEIDRVLSSLDYELEADESDTQILMYCFFEDFNKIREYLQERWCDYKEGLMTLTAVAITTNTAFDLFQRAEKELNLQLASRSVVEGFEEVTKSFFSVDVFDRDWRILNPPDALSYPGWNAEMYDKADWLCLPVYQQLKSLLAHFPPLKVAVLYTPNQDYKTPSSYGTTPEQMMNRNVTVLSQFIAEMCLHKGAKKQGMKVPAEDELQRGTIEMLESRKLPLWLVFACQIFLDVRYILEEDVDRAQQELTALGEQVEEILDDFRERGSKNQPDFIKDSIDKTYKEAHCWGVVDALGLDTRDDFHARARPDLMSRILYGKPEPYFLLRRHPIFCGLLVFRFSFAMQELGVTLANHWGATMAAAHIYNAVKSEIPDRLPWQDMETFISIHQAKHIFVGERPREPKEYWRRFELATGASAATFSAINTHTRNGSFEATRSTKGMRQIKPRAIASSYFYDRFCLDSGNSALTLASIEVLSHKIINNNERTTDTGLGNALNQVIKDEYSKTSALANRQYQGSQVLSPLQILDMLCRTIYAERSHLAFNYVGLHQRSTQVLKQMYEEFKEEVREISIRSKNPKTTMNEDEGDLPMIARLTLGLVSNASDPRIRKTLIEKVAEALTEALENQEDAIIESMQNMLSAGYPHGPNPPWSKEKWMQEQWEKRQGGNRP